MAHRTSTLASVCLATALFALCGVAAGSAQQSSATVAPLPTLPPEGPPETADPVATGVPPELSLPGDDAALGLPPADPFADGGGSAFGEVPALPAGPGSFDSGVAGGTLAGRLAREAEQRARRSLGGDEGGSFGFAAAAGLRSDRDERRLREQMRDLAAGLAAAPAAAEGWIDPDAEWRQRRPDVEPPPFPAPPGG